MASAVRVLPTPGLPCSRKMHPPPLPEITSLKAAVLLLATSDLMRVFFSLASTSRSKALSSNTTSATLSTITSPHFLAVKLNPGSVGHVIHSWSSLSLARSALVLNELYSVNSS
jgi:hypothetical protein